MSTLNITEVIKNPEHYLQDATSGSLFIYPTDTIYGIGAIVTPDTIAKIDEAKQRGPSKHYSIIAPSIARIQEHFNIQDHFADERRQYQEQFPDRGITLLLPLKMESSSGAEGANKVSEGSRKISGGTNLSLLSPTPLIGVRLIRHPFQGFIEQLGQPFITTSCNISGTDPIINVQSIPSELQNHADYIIDGGTLDGQASVVIDWVSGEILRS